MNKYRITYLLCCLFAFNGWCSWQVLDGIINYRVVDAGTMQEIYYYTDYAGNSSSITINNPRGARGRIVTALLNACYEGDALFTFCDYTSPTNSWWPDDQSNLMVSGFVVPAHTTTQQVWEPKLRYMNGNNTFFDPPWNGHSDGWYKDNWCGNIENPPTWTLTRQAVSGNSEIAGYMDNRDQYFNAFIRIISYSFENGANDYVYLQGEGFTFCYDADMFLRDITSPQTAIATETLAEIAARRTCFSWLNNIKWKPAYLPPLPDGGSKFLTFNEYPVSRPRIKNGTDSTDGTDELWIQGNWHNWDGDYTYGGYDIFYNTFADRMTKDHLIESYDGWFDHYPLP